MLILSIECSTAQAGVALVDADRSEPLGRIDWTEPRARHGNLAGAVAQLRRDTGLDWTQLDLVAAGRGPGAFSGLRMALLTAQFLAAPGGIPCRFVSGMEAAGRAWLNQQGEARAILLGDARRGHAWAAEADNSDPVQALSWELTPLEMISRRFSCDCPWLSPHLEGLRGRVEGMDAAWLSRVIPLQPDPVATARLAALREVSGAEREPPTPLYLHPPV